MKFLFLFFILLSNLIAKDILLVSIPTQKYFVKQVVKDKFIIKVMMDDNINPRNYEPTAQQYIWAEGAIAYLRLGIDGEAKWIKRIKFQNKTLQTFDTTKNIKINPIDLHIWLDPILVKVQMKNIYKIATQLDPQNIDFYKKNYLKFVNKISRIDYQVKAIFAKNKRNHFIVFHPAWGYFAKRYNLKQLIIDANPMLADKKRLCIS
jgi:zinc transport system substrate-binding protein